MPSPRTLNSSIGSLDDILRGISTGFVAFAEELVPHRGGGGILPQPLLFVASSLPEGSSGSIWGSGLDPVQAIGCGGGVASRGGAVVISSRGPREARGYVDPSQETKQGKPGRRIRVKMEQGRPGVPDLGKEA